MTASQVRDLRGVLEREGAAIGVFLTLEPATAPMRKEAAEAGIWQTKTVHGTKHPRLQIQLPYLDKLVQYISTNHPLLAGPHVASSKASPRVRP